VALHGRETAESGSTSIAYWKLKPFGESSVLPRVSTIMHIAEHTMGMNRVWFAKCTTTHSWVTIPAFTRRRSGLALERCRPNNAMQATREDARA